MNYSEAQLSSLAKNNPKELSKILISPNTDIHALTFGAELIGEEVKEELFVIPVFRLLLKHINAIVREGTLIGIGAFYVETKPPQDILDKLKSLSTNDPSPTLKEQAGDLLERFK